MDCGLCEHKIINVDENSPAAIAGVRAGDALCFINGERVRDLIDYTYLSYGEELLLSLREPDGHLRTMRAIKGEGEPLGLGFESGLMDRMQTCKNHCLFCFIDQMPKGGRDTLHVKDDDWRLSFIMGNYVSLTNVSDGEFERIIDRRVSPLYVSVHATDPALRVRLMKNPSAGRIMERLERLREAGLNFHAQLVLCPGLNDGEQLTKTIRDLCALSPACRSIAVVPVGLTRYREGLAQLRAFTREEARGVIRQVTAIARQNLKKHGTRLVFLSDEWYLVAKKALPSYDACEDFLQLENGVGLLRLAERDFKTAIAQYPIPKKRKTVSIAGGQLASRFFAPALRRLILRKRKILIYPLENRYFGGNVHVAGLLTGSDLAQQLRGNPLGEALLIPGNMLREGEDVFLDGMTLTELSGTLDIPIYPFRNGEEEAELLFGGKI